MEFSSTRPVLSVYARKGLANYQIFNYESMHRYIPYNPYLDAEKPRADQSEDIETEAVVLLILNPSEINAFIKATEDQKYQTLFRLAKVNRGAACRTENNVFNAAGHKMVTVD